MRCLTAFGVALLLTQSSSIVAQGVESPLWSGLKAGSYPVGFRTLYLRDSSRHWQPASPAARDPGRPIRVSVWYPALRNPRSAAMTYGDYFRHEGPPDFRRLDETLDKNDRDGWLADLTELSPNGHDLLTRLFATPVASHANAPFAAGRFPVLLYAKGKGSRSDANVELAEYLASYGYVVATVPRLGASESDIELGSSPAESRIAERDLDVTWRAIRQLPWVDSTRLAIAGHSAGGIVALEFAMTHLGVAAVVGLDGSYGMRGEAKPGTATRSSAELFPEFLPTRVTAAVLDLRRPAGIQEAVLDPSVIAALTRSDRYEITIPRMYHGDFTEWAPIAVYLDVPWKTQADGRTRKTGLEGNQYAYRAILDFLDATVRQAPARLDSTQVDVQKLVGVTVTRQPPRLPSP